MKPIKHRGLNNLFGKPILVYQGVAKCILILWNIQMIGLVANYVICLL